MYKGKTLRKTLGRYMNTLGMTFEFLTYNRRRTNMCKYISKIIADSPEEIVRKSATPAADHLFKIGEDGCKLNEELAKAFHHTVCRLLFATN
jgi:hypothetical protein